MQIKKYDILIINLNPTFGSEQKGIRPCMVVQNNQFNERAQTTVVCPITSVIKHYPHHLIVQPSSQNSLRKRSRLDLLQIRTIDKGRITKKIGTLDEEYRDELKAKFFVSFDLDDIL